MNVNLYIMSNFVPTGLHKAVGHCFIVVAQSLLLTKQSNSCDDESFSAGGERDIQSFNYFPAV